MSQRWLMAAASSTGSQLRPVSISKEAGIDAGTIVPQMPQSDPGGSPLCNRLQLPAKKARARAKQIEDEIGILGLAC